MQTVKRVSFQVFQHGTIGAFLRQELEGSDFSILQRKRFAERQRAGALTLNGCLMFLEGYLLMDKNFALDWQPFSKITRSQWLTQLSRQSDSSGNLPNHQYHPSSR